MPLYSPYQLPTNPGPQECLDPRRRFVYTETVKTNTNLDCTTEYDTTGLAGQHYFKKQCIMLVLCINSTHN